METRDRRTDMMRLADAFFSYLTQEESYGGWGLDPKRPFGNSDIAGDILELIETLPEEKEDEHDVWSEEQLAYARSLYAGLGDFLRQEWECYRQNLREQYAS